MIRRAFIRALSGAILTTLLGLRPWRLAVEDTTDLWPAGPETPFVDLGDLIRRVYDEAGISYDPDGLAAFVAADQRGPL
jgi:hypothetical protein